MERMARSRGKWCTMSICFFHSGGFSQIFFLYHNTGSKEEEENDDDERVRSNSFIHSSSPKELEGVARRVVCLAVTLPHTVGTVLLSLSRSHSHISLKKR